MANDRAKVVDAPSLGSMAEASRNRAKFSGHGKAKGAAGYRDPSVNDYEGTYASLSQPGQSVSVNPSAKGIPDFHIGVAWHNMQVRQAGFFGKVFKTMINVGVDLDLGCLYELQDGTRGAIQAFGEKFGAFDKPPYIRHSGDERTGNTGHEDERIFINGAKWGEIKKIIVYLYIYEGATKWAHIRPQVHIDLPGERDLAITLGAYDDALELCVLAELENVRGGIKLTNASEYFPGHAEMDRAYGFGLEWADGKK